MSLWRSSSSDSKGKVTPVAPSVAGPQAADLLAKYMPEITEALLPGIDVNENRTAIAQMVKTYLRDAMKREKIELNVLEQRTLVNDLTQGLRAELSKKKPSIPLAPEPNVPVHGGGEQPEPYLNGTDDNSGYTQIVEEGVTVFGADPDAPVEVRAQFDRPAELRHSDTDVDSEDEEEIAPIVPVAKSAEEEEEPDENDKSASLFNISMAPETTGVKINAQLEAVKNVIQPLLMERIDISAAVTMDRLDLARDISDIVTDILIEERIQLNQREQRELTESLMHDMLGLGPLEPLLADESITDIMVNGPKQVFVEQKGKLVLSDCQFRDNAHVMQVAGRIVSHVGRRVDESNPLVDARLADGICQAENHS